MFLQVARPRSSKKSLLRGPVLSIIGRGAGASGPKAAFLVRKGYKGRDAFQRSSGFTLLEVMMAIALMAIALTAVF